MSKPKPKRPNLKPLKPGTNPRQVLKSHRERGPVRYFYTAEQVAELSGVSKSTIQRATRNGLDLSSFGSVVNYVAGKREERYLKSISNFNFTVPLGVSQDFLTFSMEEVVEVLGGESASFKTRPTLKEICDLREKRRWEQHEICTDEKPTDLEHYRMVLATIHSYLLQYKPEYAPTIARALGDIAPKDLTDFEKRFGHARRECPKCSNVMGPLGHCEYGCNRGLEPYFTHEVKPGSTSVPCPAANDRNADASLGIKPKSEFLLNKRVSALNKNMIEFHKEARAAGYDPVALLKEAERQEKRERTTRPTITTSCCAYAMGMEGGSMCDDCYRSEHAR